MNILLDLFLTFLKIGAFSFGGGYGMISFVREEVLLHSWLSESEFLNIIAVAESTPGPIAVNMATFIGSTQAGILGSICATLGVILPSFIIILLISAVLKNLLKLNGVKAVLGGIRPATVALIVGTALTMALTVLFGFNGIGSGFSVDVKNLIILGLIILIGATYKKCAKKKISPIILILISGLLGILFFYI
jgi:chromate transporter